LTWIVIDAIEINYSILLYPVTAYGIDTSVIEINRSLALTRNNLNIITITHTMYL